MPPSYWFTTLEIPAKIRVADADGNPDSLVCNLNADDSLDIIFSEHHSQTMTIGEFCKSCKISLNKLGDLCCTDEVVADATHRFIYG